MLLQKRGEGVKMPRVYYTATCEIKKGEEIIQRLELKEQQVGIRECSSFRKIRQSREILTRSDPTDQILHIQARLALYPCKENSKPHWHSGLKSHRLPLGKQPDPSWREISARTKLALALLAPLLTPELPWHPECSRPSCTIAPQGCPSI